MTDLNKKVDYDNDVIQAAIHKLLMDKGRSIQSTQVPDGWLPTDPELEAAMEKIQINKSWGLLGS